jgi:cytochrome c oxidase cbb3-type subunit 3
MGYQRDMRRTFLFASQVLMILAAGESLAQGQGASAPANPAGQPGRGGFGRSAYPQRPPADPATVERGKGLYSVNCGFCHGSDARGGEGGPNLIRSATVLDDAHGELIAPIVRGGKADGKMPAFNLAPTQISDIVAFLHSLPVGGRDASRSAPASILVGDAAAGKAFFAQKCSSCHSESGDLKSLATRIPDPKTLQQTWLMPGGDGRGGRGGAAAKVQPVTVTVTTSSGEKINGRLARVDDFVVTLIDADGNLRSYQRRGQVQVALHNPLQPHMDLLPTYTDQNIHDLTAYLVTLK